MASSLHRPKTRDAPSFKDSNKTLLGIGRRQCFLFAALFLMPESFPDLRLQFLAQFRIILQQLLDRIPALPQPGFVITEP